MAETESSRAGRNVITGQTLMPLGVMVAIVLGLWRGSAFLEARFSQLQESDRIISEQLTLIKLSLNDRWTLTDQRLWEQSLKINNPSLVVPDSLNIVRRSSSVATSTP